MRQVGYEVVDVGLSGGGYHLLHRHVATVVSILDVLTDAAVEQGGLLRHDTDLGPQPPQLQAA